MGGCAYLDGSAPDYHAECDDVRMLNPSADFLAATEYSFKPLASEKARRQAYVLARAARCLQKAFPALPRLAGHLWHMVASYLVRQFAAITTEDLWQHRRSYNSHFCLSSSIIIDGIFYIASLSNKPDKDSYLVWDGGTTKLITTVYVAEDHLGIRQILFLSQQALLTLKTAKIPGLW